MSNLRTVTSTMPIRKLGQTGMEVSVVGFGASPLGNVFGYLTRSEVDRTVAHAIANGINLFDVSPYYGDTLAEKRLGCALEGCRSDVILATKCGRYGTADFDFSALTIVERFEESLRRLRTEYVDVLQVHDVEFASIQQIVNETLPALEKLKEQGKARFIGVTGYWPGFLAKIARQSNLDTVLNYCHWNLLMDDMDHELTPLVTKLGIGLMNASPLHMGLLAGQSVPEWHPAPNKVRATTVEIAQVCKRYGVTPAMVALSVTLKHPLVASTFVGLQSVAQVEDALCALDFDAEPELMAEIRTIAGQTFNVSWPSGLPENQPMEVA